MRSPGALCRVARARIRTAKLAEETRRLDWLIRAMNTADDPEEVIEELFDSLPGDSEDVLLEFRAAIDDAIRKGCKAKEGGDE
jgi:hypothetical protein